MATVKARQSLQGLFNPFVRLGTTNQAREAANAGVLAAAALALLSALQIVAVLLGHADSNRLETSKTLAFGLFGIIGSVTIAIAIRRSQELWAAICLAICLSIQLAGAVTSPPTNSLFWIINYQSVIWTILCVRGTFHLKREASGQSEVISPALKMLLTAGAALLFTVVGLTVWASVTSPLKPQSSKTKAALHRVSPIGSKASDLQRRLQAQGMSCWSYRNTTFLEDVADDGKQTRRAPADYVFCDGSNQRRPFSTRWQIAIYEKNGVISYVAVSTSRFRR